MLPFDNAAPAQFIDLWNRTLDQAQAWRFIYNQILYVYDMLFSVMLEYVDLGSQAAVEKNASSILSAISATAEQESTYAMPINARFIGRQTSHAGALDLPSFSTTMKCLC